MFKHILLPTDGSPISMAGVAKGLALAQRCGASVTVLTVLPPRGFVADTGPAPDEADAEEEARKRLDVAQGEAKELGVACTCVVAFDELPSRAILEAAHARDCDLIAMTPHGRRGPGLFLGSETHRVIVNSDIPVLVLK